MADYSIKEKLIRETSQLNRNEVLRLCRELLDSDTDPSELFGLLRFGLEDVTRSYLSGEYFIADMLMGDRIFSDVVNLIEESGKGSPLNKIGTILIGTVEGDIHDIGKNLVALLLRFNGFEVVDMGVSVTPKEYADAVMTYAPNILVLSGTISGSEIMMARTIEELEDRGIRSGVRVLLGGPCIDERTSYAIGADGFSKDPMDTLMKCRMYVLGEA